jgi:hypothetical protein
MSYQESEVKWGEVAKNMVVIGGLSKIILHYQSNLFSLLKIENIVNVPNFSITKYPKQFYLKNYSNSKFLTDAPDLTTD